MNELKKELLRGAVALLLFALLGTIGASAQSSVGDAVKKGATDTFFNSLEAAKRAKEQEKAMRKKYPDWMTKELGVPYVGLELGWSHFRGEHVGVKAALMGFNVFGGIGQEWIFSNHSDKSLLWYAGCGYYFGDTYDGSGESSIDITVGQTPVCHDIGIMGSFSMGYFFGDTKRFGVKGTLGVGGGNLDQDEMKFIWEVGVGIIVKLWAD